MRYLINYFGHSGEPLGQDIIEASDLEAAIKHADQKVANSRLAMSKGQEGGVAEYAISESGGKLHRYPVRSAGPT